MKNGRAVIVQCRLSSTRLPGKALKTIKDVPVLGWVLASMKKVRAERYFVATDPESYDMLLPVCEEYGFECFKGDLNDVLKRFCDLIKTLDVKTIIRATADNPFLFYEAAEASVQDFEERNSGNFHCDYLTYSGLPHGSGVEIFSAKSLLEAATQTSDPYDHEHVGPALYNHKDKFICDFIKAPARFNYPHLRTTIDTYSDFLRAQQIADYLYKSEKTETKSKGKPALAYSTEQILEACNSKPVNFPVVMVPSVAKGKGTGHLHRCLTAALNNSFFVYIPKDKTLKETDSIVQEYLEKGLDEFQIIDELPEQSYSPVIVSDAFELTKNQIEEFSKFKSLISIDEGSGFTNYCDYLLDIIPSFALNRIPNLDDSGFIEKPLNVKKDVVKKSHISKILVCLGGEDPAGFTIPACNAIHKCCPDAKIQAIVSDSLTPYKDFSDEKIEFIKPVPELKEKLFEYDLVITHYGLTAFEALFAGCGVILLPTTKLHKNLAQKYDFAYVQNSEITPDSMLQAFASKNVFTQKDVSKENKDLGEFIKNLSLGNRYNCPVCDKKPLNPDTVISRNSTRTYRRCQNCGMVYISWSSVMEKKYQKQYFFEEYKNQYGKTYQEDFENIKQQGLRRLSEIKMIAGNLKDKTVLDIGCAYGPFLSAALDNKMNCFGTDISDDAVNYVNSTLRIPASTAAFPDINTSEEFGIPQFDVITMWYVIEHFNNLDQVLSKVCSIVKKGGVFAFSTPSGEGISAKSDVEHFYQISPADHYSVWEPSRAGKILKKYGFEVVKIVSTGHHPERFPSIKKSDAKKGSLKWNVVDKVSRLKKLGDTMEIYAIKK